MSVLEIANRVRVLVLLGCLGLAAIASPAGREAQCAGYRPRSGRLAVRPWRRVNGGAADESADTAATDQAGTRTAEAGESFLGWMIRASGPIGVAIAVMSFYLVALVAKMFLDYRSTVTAPRGLVSDVEGLLDKRKYNEAYTRLVEDESFLARVLAAGVRKLPAGMTQAHRAMELANEDVTMQMEHRTTYLATVGTLGPMIGLVGTVYGMILAFRVIAQAGSSPQAADLAKGISTALFATLEGIAISIPAIYFYAMFRNRDRAALAGGGLDGRAAARAVRAGRAAGRAGPGPERRCQPVHCAFAAAARPPVRRQCRPGGGRGRRSAAGPPARRSIAGRQLGLIGSDPRSAG